MRTPLPPPCPGFDEDLSALLDGALAPEREARVRAHLATCDACARRLDAFALADAALGASRARPVPPARVVPLRRRRRWLGAAAGAAGALAAGLAAILLARPGDAPRGVSPGGAPPVIADAGDAPQAVAPAAKPEPDALATATDDELELVDEIDTIEDLDLIENLELVERFAARGRS